MKNLNLSTRLWIYAGACLVVCLFIGWQFYTNEYAGYDEKNETLTMMIENKELALVKIRTQNQRKAHLEKEIEIANEEFKKHQEMFPDEDFIPKRLQDLTKVTRRSSVRPISFKPQRITEKEFYMENAYQIKVIASYHALGTFFEEIANLHYPTGINAMTIQSSPDPNANNNSQAPQTISAQFQLITFTSKQ